MNAYLMTPLDVLGDPTRRRVLELLRDGPRSVSEVAALLPVSRPAVSQHLAALRRAGLVTYGVEGRRHLYAVDRAALAETRAWFDAFWDVSLERYANAAASPGAAAARAVEGTEPAGRSGADAPTPATKKPKKRGKRKKKSRKERP